MSIKNIPDDFFDNLPDRILNRISEEEHTEHTQELLDNSKILPELRSQNPYKVPEKYFDLLAGRKIVNPNKIRKLTMITSIAASLLIMMLIIVENGSNDISISEDDIIAYYVDDLQDIEHDLLSELIVVDEEEASIEDYILEEMISELSDSELDLLSQNL